MGWKRASILMWIIGWWTLSSWGAVPQPLRPVVQEKAVTAETRKARGTKSISPDSIAGRRAAAGEAMRKTRGTMPLVTDSAQRDTREVVPDSVSVAAGDSVAALGQDSVPLMITDSLGSLMPGDSIATRTETHKRWRTSSFNPDPMRAVWLSALFPGLGQIYNRRYWKLPIVVGGYVGLFYATTWNSNMLADYQRAYLDIMDSDPTTNSYMDFFSSAYKEEDIDKAWLTSVLKQRKDYYRQYRDLCIICMIGLYAVCMIDAYVDAQLYHFDISPDISMQWQPAIIPTGRSALPAVGLQCAITF